MYLQYIALYILHFQCNDLSIYVYYVAMSFIIIPREENDNIYVPAWPVWPNGGKAPIDNDLQIRVVIFSIFGNLSHCCYNV